MNFARILVGLDASPLSLAALDAAHRLALCLGADLHGLYVEDVNLARLCGHPQAALISPLHRRRRDDHRDLIGDALKLQQAAVRRAFAALDLPPPSLILRRGRVRHELHSAATTCDLLVLGWHGRDPKSASAARLGSVTQALAENPPCPLLLVRQTSMSGDAPWQGLAALPSDETAVTLAEHLANRLGLPWSVIVHPDCAPPGHLMISSRPATLECCADAVLLLPVPQSA